LYRTRYYSPNLGRWVSEDPIGLGGGSHLSAYVSNNPTNLIDPFGLCEQDPKVVYGESSGLYPRQKPRPPDAKNWSIYDPKTWDPESYDQLQQARRDVADISERNKVVHSKDGSKTKNPIERRAWNDSVRAAKEAETMNLPADVTKFYLRQDADNDGKGDKYPYWAPEGTVPYKTYGPFVNVGGGDPPKGNNTYVDLYRGIK
jgi:uncharacterized protein RhaS with RHS repeats